MSNSLDLGETASYSPSHPDPSCLLFAYGTIVVLGGLRVNVDFVGDLCITFHTHLGVTCLQASIMFLRLVAVLHRFGPVFTATVICPTVWGTIGKSLKMLDVV